MKRRIPIYFLVLAACSGAPSERQVENKHAGNPQGALEASRYYGCIVRAGKKLGDRSAVTADQARLLSEQCAAYIEEAITEYVRIADEAKLPLHGLLPTNAAPPTVREKRLWARMEIENYTQRHVSSEVWGLPVP